MMVFAFNGAALLSICMNGASISLLEGLDTPQCQFKIWPRSFSSRTVVLDIWVSPRMFDRYSHADVLGHERELKEQR